ncbi:hypothetical protein CRP_074 [Candidatus Carsonella ruddii PV]|uniref:PLD phosphodiesterase domain-containing protein n=1 Tax=Carsonella ruddii (strain PV) TaxID=387662 RepID=Q05FR6_CARRP|nr:hypothetical protein CRP_074 [Candidatus Carsonella ruddii PV]
MYTHVSSIIFLKILKLIGISFFFTKNGFNHRKIYIIDKSLIFFGSMNFDNRSIYLNFESLFLITNKNFIKIFLKSLFIKINCNFYNYKKKKIVYKILYIVSFLNYLNI